MNIFKTDKHYKIILILLLMLNISNLPGQEIWQQTNGPKGGNIQTIFINSGNHIFAGTADGGVFRSTDNGDNWVDINDGLTSYNIHDLGVNSTSDIFVGTHHGVFRSVNNGDYWSSVNNGVTDYNIYSISINSNNHIFAGSSSGGIFRSTDNGAFWYQVNNGLTSTTIFALAINNNNDIFAGTADGGVFRSTDNGVSWVQVNNGLTDTTIYSLAINNNNDIFVGTYSGVFRSTDNGDNWIQINNGLATNDIQSLAINSSNVIFAGTNDGGVFRSTDNGDNWIQINSGLTGYSISSLAFNNNNDVFCGSSSFGMFRSIDNGDNWVGINNGLIATNVLSLAVNNNNDIFAGLHRGGVFLTNNNGASWTMVNNGSPLPTVNFTVIVINGNNDIFAGSVPGGIFRSTDNGDSWVQVNNGLTSTFIYTLAFNNNDDIFAGTYYGIFRSTDNGENWTQINNGLPATKVFAMAITSNDVIFAGTDNEGIFRSTDNGDSWIQVNNGVTSNFIYTLAVNSNNDIYAGTHNQGLLRSTNNGSSWVQVLSTRIEYLTINSNNNYIFAANSSYVFSSKDNGETWTSNDELFPIRWLMISNDNRVFLGTFGQGVFINNIPSVLSVPQLVSPNNTRINVPHNPFLQWNTVSGAESYFLQVAEVSDFSNIVYEQRGIIGTSHQISGSNTGTNYFWRVKAENFFTESEWSDTWNFATVTYPNNIDISSPTYQFPHHDDLSLYTPQDYRIVGTPGGSITKSFADIMQGNHGTDWQAYFDNGVNSGNLEDYFVEYNGGSEFRFGEGRAFWIIYKGDLLIQEQGVPTIGLNANEEAEIHLHPGWNLITNPFDSPIEWWQVQQSNTTIGPIFKYDGTDNWQNSDDHFTYFDPYVGYYVDSPGNMTLYIPYGATMSKPLASPNYKWQLEILLSTNETIKSSAKIGVSAQSNKNRDMLDYRKPRSVGAVPSVYLNRPEWDEGYGMFYTDIRPELQDVEEWEFTVSGIVNQKTTISFSAIEDIPVQHEIYLVDENHSVYVNLREKSEYSFVPVTNTSNFSILVGNQESIYDKLENLIPTEFQLGENFPNPFNPSTTIPVAVPEESALTLKVYNVLGQEIQTIFDGAKEAGKHYFRWDGTNYLNQQVAAGVYLYRLNTDKGHTFVGKMVLVK